MGSPEVMALIGGMVLLGASFKSLKAGRVPTQMGWSPQNKPVKYWGSVILLMLGGLFNLGAGVYLLFFKS